LQPSELDFLPFYEYEYTLQYYNELLQERKEGEEKNTKEQSDKYNIKGMQNSMSKGLPSTKMPSFSMPKMPSF
jgi:hypothetical protein